MPFLFVVLESMMMNVLSMIEAGVSVLLVLCILLQQRASGLSSGFSGGDSPYVQRRGIEKILYQATMVFGCVFFGVAVLQWYF